MSHDATDEARPVTSVELLNAAVWREIGWEEPQTPAAFVLGVVSGRLRINGTQSAPEGIYWAIGKEPSKGDFVFALPPAEPVFSLAKERGYLGPGPSLAGTCALLKASSGRGRGQRIDRCAGRMGKRASAREQCAKAGG